MSLPSDIARCRGYEPAHICSTCERRAQISRDDPARFFWIMSPAVDRGRCVYYITTPAAVTTIPPDGQAPAQG